jgi:hypothetical protein
MGGSRVESGEWTIDAQSLLFRLLEKCGVGQNGEVRFPTGLVFGEQIGTAVIISVYYTIK